MIKITKKEITKRL